MSSLKSIGKGIYDILAAYLLIWVIYLALVSLAFHTIATLIIGGMGYDETYLFWRKHAFTYQISPLTLRLIVFGSAHLVVLFLLRNIIRNTMASGEYVFDLVQKVYLKIGAKLPSVQRIVGTTFTIMVTLLLIPFVLQPTTVGMRMDADAWKARAVNLIDGRASLGLADSVIGFYRKFWAEPVIVPEQKISKKDLKDAFKQDTPNNKPGPYTLKPNQMRKSPLMDRWDPLIWKAANNDRRRFAMIKAFMYVESGGKQFAVSHTGCAGLMQFCSGTAKRGPFKAIFGRGQVYACGCRKTSCRVDRAVQRDLESGDIRLIKSHANNFPCEITDARFDASKAIRAGAKYIELLDNSVNGNIYLMYVGYNSGPRIAKRVFNQTQNKGTADLSEIETHLANEMLPYYGQGSHARARSLLRTHLPKIKRAYDRYYMESLNKRPDISTPDGVPHPPKVPINTQPGVGDKELLNKKFAPQ